MDGDGELQRKDDLSLSMPCATKSRDRRSGSESDNSEDHDENMDNGKDSDASHDADEDDGDTIDGALPSLAAIDQQTKPLGIKRRHIKTERMQEYQQQLTNTAIPRQARQCPVCGHTLFSGPGFRYHQQKHKDGNETFTCNSCYKVFKSSNGLKYHLKKKRCQGGIQVTPSCKAATDTHAPAPITRAPAPLVLDGDNRAEERLMVLADIATGPGSPLLRSPGPDSRGSATESFFDESETTAVMALSNMRKKHSCEPRKGTESTSGVGMQILHHTDKHHHQDKPKRPMNGFMLFAQRNRAGLNKKYPEMNNRMISTKLSEEWASLPDLERQKWKDEARQKAEQHQKDYPDCWKRKK